MGSGMFQARVPASTPYEKDPRTMPAMDPSDGCLLFDASDTTTAAFWAAFTSIGSFQTADPSTATRTIVNVASGRGRLTGCIGPNVGAGATTTFTITIDGVAYTYAVPIVNGRRLVLGDIIRADTMYTTAARGGMFGISTEPTVRSGSNILNASHGGVVPHQVINPVMASRWWKFDVSLKVEIAVTTINAAAQAAWSGAVWNLDA